MGSYTAIVLDVEAASLETSEVIQLAWATPDRGQRWQQKYRPSGTIQLGALATHHILPDELLHCEPSAEAISHVPQCQYVIGHNVSFDADALGGMPGVKRICTLALAKHAWPNLDCHKLGALAYHVLGVSDDTRQLLRGAHDAGVDVEVCLSVFDKIAWQIGAITSGLFGYDYERLHQISEEAKIPKVMPFGKHKGTPIAEVPADYVAWLMRQDNVDPLLRVAFDRLAVAK